jgi:hypothetical protein
VADVSSGLSLTPPQEIKKTSILLNVVYYDLILSMRSGVSHTYEHIEMQSKM